MTLPLSKSNTDFSSNQVEVSKNLYTLGLCIVLLLFGAQSLALSNIFASASCYHTHSSVTMKFS